MLFLILKFPSMKKILFPFIILCFCTGCETKSISKNEIELPQYQTLLSTEVYTGKGKVGEVLIPSLSRQLSAVEREKTLRNIMKSERWTMVSAYATKEAYNQKSCAPYSQRQKAYKEGFIGGINEFGKFYE